MSNSVWGRSKSRCLELQASQLMSSAKNILQKLKFNTVLTRLSGCWLAENASQSPFETRQGKTKPVRMSWRDIYWEPHVEREREREGGKNPSLSTRLCPWNTFPAAPPTVGDSDGILSAQHSPSAWLMSLILPINGESPVDFHQITVFICYSYRLWFILISRHFPHVTSIAPKIPK